ncbi:hypothetical protein B0T21DRAFT_368570 [Apiosordaria backusii]|uniref:BZIP domain-containing protein n=1 Tax=Apiosordaria backusii TaxID=314023 RepID=A0AA40BKB5_9PEZI|nr:hypothetical protein B0T21DRAFT_368570 [Apiosordaria backusii]
MSSDDQKKQAHLTRIRTNQRLSRARRKEYISSLEARIREYEEKGVHATLEIQLAARKVAEENKKLRELLGKVGVSEFGIREYLNAGAPTSPAIPVTTTQSGVSPTQKKQGECECECEGERKNGRDPEPNECSMAADLISLITGADTTQVRVTMGCAPGRNCDVDDAAIETTITRLKSQDSS